MCTVHLCEILQEQGFVSIVASAPTTVPNTHTAINIHIFVEDMNGRTNEPVANQLLNTFSLQKPF